MKDLSEKDASILEHPVKHCKIIADCLHRFGSNVEAFKKIRFSGMLWE